MPAGAAGATGAAGAGWDGEEAKPPKLSGELSEVENDILSP
tara:strand:+ start:357 stop:479 length:123 start_codon:yes stop_codon:yes gene_type:complete